MDLKLGIRPKAGNFLSGKREGRGRETEIEGRDREIDGRNRKIERQRQRNKETELTIKIPSKAG